MIDVLQVATFVVILVIGVAWYLSYSAARLDRLHAKVEGAMSALDAQLVRRAEAALELANSGALDPASALLLADAATESLERTTGGPPRTSSTASTSGAARTSRATSRAALRAALTDEVVAGLRNGARGRSAREALDRVGASGLRVRLARRFHNDATHEVRRVRRQAVGAGRSGWPATPRLPEPVEFDDDLPPALGG